MDNWCCYLDQWKCSNKEYIQLAKKLQYWSKYKSMTRVATFFHKRIIHLLFMCPLKDKWTVATLCLCWVFTAVWQLATTCNNSLICWTLSTPLQRMVSNILENDLPGFCTYVAILSKGISIWFPHMGNMFATDIYSETTHWQLAKEYFCHQVQCDSQRPSEEWSPEASKGQIHMDCFVSLTTAISILSTVIIDVQTTEGHLHL